MPVRQGSFIKRADVVHAFSSATLVVLATLVMLSAIFSVTVFGAVALLDIR